MIMTLLRVAQQCIQDTGAKPREWILHERIHRIFSNELMVLRKMKQPPTSMPLLEGIPIRWTKALNAPTAAYRDCHGDVHVVNL